MRALGLPFWLAGGYGQPERLAAARAAGAAGVQVGTAFAFCEESGLRPDYKEALLAQVRAGDGARVHRSAGLADLLSVQGRANSPARCPDAAVYDGARARLRPRLPARGLPHGRRAASASAAPAEPVAAYVAKGGAVADTVGRKCVCNALMANIGLGQVRGRSVEPGLVTAGDDLAGLTRYMRRARHPLHGRRRHRPHSRRSLSRRPGEAPAEPPRRSGRLSPWQSTREAT